MSATSHQTDHFQDKGTGEKIPSQRGTLPSARLGIFSSFPPSPGRKCQDRGRRFILVTSQRRCGSRFLTFSSGDRSRHGDARPASNQASLAEGRSPEQPRNVVGRRQATCGLLRRGWPVGRPRLCDSGGPVHFTTL